MYEELIAALNAADKRPCSDLECPGSGECHTVGCLFRVAADAIEYLVRLRNAAEENRLRWERMAVEFEIAMHTAEEKLPKWIPVTERLPFPGDKVIVAIKDESGDTRFDFTNTGWWSGYDYKFVVEDEFCSWVTHWMPLPKPPKEKSDEL